MDSDSSDDGPLARKKRRLKEASIKRKLKLAKELLEQQQQNQPVVEPQKPEPDAEQVIEFTQAPIPAPIPAPISVPSSFSNPPQLKPRNNPNRPQAPLPPECSSTTNESVLKRQEAARASMYLKSKPEQRIHDFNSQSQTLSEFQTQSQTQSQSQSQSHTQSQTSSPAKQHIVMATNAILTNSAAQIKKAQEKARAKIYAKPRESKSVMLGPLNNKKKSNSDTPMYPDGWEPGDESARTPRCKCQSYSVERTVKKEGQNKGKQFFVCQQPMGSPDNCGNFVWKIGWYNEQFAKEEESNFNNENGIVSTIYNRGSSFVDGGNNNKTSNNTAEVSNNHNQTTLAPLHNSEPLLPYMEMFSLYFHSHLKLKNDVDPFHWNRTINVGGAIKGILFVSSGERAAK